MPRLIVPSIGGGTKLIRTLLPGGAEDVCSGMGDGVGDPSAGIERAGDSWGCTEGVDDSCAAAVQAKTAAINVKLARAVMSNGRDISYFPQRMSRDSSTSLGITSGLDVVTPVHISKQIVAPFAVAQEFVIDMIRDKLIV